MDIVQSSFEPSAVGSFEPSPVGSFEPSTVGSEVTDTAAMVDQVIEQVFIDSESVPETDSSPELDSEKLAPTYDEAFPPLAGGLGGGTSAVVGGMAGAMPPARPAKKTMPRVKTSTVTSLFHIPLSELLGGDHTGTVKHAAAQTNTQIEVSKSRDGSMTMMVTGKAAAVNEAKIKLQKELQTNATASISIPKEHHKMIMGKNRKMLEQLQSDTGTLITLPRQGSEDSTIKIEGRKEDIERAIHKMRVISDQQYHNHRESVMLPKKFFPWIKGGRENTYVEKLNKQTGCRINIPPPKANNEEVIIVGEKDKVTACITHLQDMCRKMEETFSNLHVEIRQSQHKYIERKGGLQQIFEKTEVWVEIPTDGSSTINLTGPEDKLSSALSMLFEKANSIKTTDIDCPAWLLKYIIGKNGENIKSLYERYPNITIDCKKESNIITIDAPHEDFDTAKDEITKRVNELIQTHSRAVVKIDSKIHKHLIGKSGANINKIKAETGVNIKIPQQDGDSEIEIIGSPDGVKKARDMLVEQAKKIENEANVELAIDQKWHRILIGAKGENMQKIRSQFPEVMISFPVAGKKDVDSNKVTVRGQKKDVDKVTAMIKKQVGVIQEENFSMKVPILKSHHRYIIGKGGINIKKIKEETNTRIDLPSEDNDSNVIVITGKKADVDNARKRLLAIQAELEGIYEIDVKIDPKIHNTLIGSKGRIIRAIIEESGDVQIKFPSADNPSEKVNIRGEKAHVEKARAKLLSLALEKELESYCVEVKANNEYHGFLIGKKGSNVQKLKKEFGVNYAFPRPDDKDQETITIMGKQDAVEKAAADLRTAIKELENTAEEELSIDPKFFKKITSRSTIEPMTRELGGIKIVPRPSSNTVKISGPKTCVAECKEKLETMVEELTAQIEIMVEIPRQFHRDIIGTGGVNVRKLTSENGVQVTFPPQRQQQKSAPVVAEVPVDNGHPAENGAVETTPDTPAAEEKKVEVPAGPDPQDMIKVVGRPENCERAKEILLSLIPVSEVIEIPFEYHRSLIGQKGENIRKLMDTHDVNIQVPGTTLKSDSVTVRGQKPKVEECLEALKDFMTVWEGEKEDRALRSFSHNLTVDHRHHAKIIGRKGAVISKIKEEHGVIIKMPDRNGSGDPDLITIIGYEAKANAARDAIMAIVSELENRVSDTVEIDSRIHARLIGQRGKNIRKIMDKFGVDITFTGGEGGNTVTVEGNQENVEECKEHLLELEEEYMDAVLDRMEQEGNMAQYSRPTSQPQQGYFVRGAPWQQPGAAPQTAPDTTDMSAFPGLGSTSAPIPQPGSWGRNKRW